MIRVNDKWNVEYQAGMSLHDLLRACEFTHHHIVVSVNGALVLPEEFEAHILSDRDRVLVIHVIGGG